MPSPSPTTIRSNDYAYTVVAALGEGGQTRAQLVERVGEPGSRFVLKQLRMEHVEDWKQVELFERQVDTLAALDHPGIPTLVDRIVQDERTAGIVETYVEGLTVAQQIAEHGPLSPARFEQILRDCLEVLAYLQRQVPPVLHRDINPKNVMIGPDRASIIDFGAVRVGGKTDMTSVGTFGYMAPEQIIGRVEPASDMYGLGMTMVSLGERRDVGDLPIDPTTGQVQRDRLLQTVDPRLRDVVLGMIQPGVAARLGEPAEALRRLDQPALPAVEPPASLAPTPSHPTSTALIVVVSALAVVAIAVVMLIVTAPGDDARAQPPEVDMVGAQPSPRLDPVVAVPPPKPVEPAQSAAPPQLVDTELSDDDSAKLNLTSAPPGARARVLDIACTTPCSLRVPFGKHTVQFELGDRQVDREVRVLEDTSLHIALER